MSPFTSLAVLAYVVAIGLFILGAGLANAAAKKRPRPPMNAVPAPRTPKAPARATNPCAARGHVIPGWAHNRDVWFCVREGCTYTAAYCRDEDLPYDQEAVAVFDAARKITREAAGGAA